MFSFQAKISRDRFIKKYIYIYFSKNIRFVIISGIDWRLSKGGNENYRINLVFNKKTK